MPLNPLNHHYAMENPASVYDEEAMTALELAGRTTAKVNETVQAFNKLEAETNEHLDKQDATIPVKVVEAVQSHINNGAFDHAIDLYAGGLEKQVEQLISSIPEGSTTMDAEVIDGRRSETGTVYPNLGTAIRSQVESAEVNALRFFNVNRLNPDTVSPGYINPTNGVIYASNDHYTSDFIRILPGETIKAFDSNMVECRFRFVCTYNENKELIPYEGDFPEVPSYTQSGEVAYVRVTIRYEYGTPIMVTSTSASEFVLYDKAKIKDSALPESVATLPGTLWYTNLYDSSQNVEGWYVDYGSGGLFPNEGLFTTGYMPVTPGQRLSLFNQNMDKLTVRMYAWFNENMEYISGGELDTVLTAPSGAKYLRLSTQNENRTIMITDTNCYRFMEQGVTCIRMECLPANLLNTSDSMAGGQVNRSTMAEMPSGSTIGLNGFPWYTKKNTAISFYGDFDTFAPFEVGRGPGAYCALYVKVTASTVELHEYLTGDTVLATHNHGLNFRNFVNVILDMDKDGMLHVTITTRTGTFTFEYDAEFSWCGYGFATTSGDMRNCVLSGACHDLAKPLWILGDSYLGYSDQRVMGWVKNFGYNNIMVSAQPGLGSGGAYDELIRCLNYGTPKVLVWYLGMNDNYGAFAEVLPQVVETCKQMGITLIVNRVPTVPGLKKGDFFTLIQSMGLRYIDSYAVVDTDENGMWRDSFLSGDNVHPAELGARALATRMLVDVPEIMSYGRE